VNARQRLLVIVLVLGALACAGGLVLFAMNACPAAGANRPCPGATFNRIVVMGLAALGTLLLVAPFAFLAEFVVRRRIVYRGAWGRAARRGLLLAAVVAALAGLRLGGALTVPVALFAITLAGIVEWFALHRFDAP
jgi:hypothetical protein